MTPPRTIAVAVLTIAAVVASPFAAGVMAGLLAGNHPTTTFHHVLWHLLWALLSLASALGIRRIRRAWPAPAPDLPATVRVSGEKQYQLLALAQALALAGAAGQFLAGAGAAALDFNELYWARIAFAIVHLVGDLTGLGSLGALLIVCLHMLGVGIQGALRPTAHASRGAIN